jgi:hypothetical protein
MHSVHIGDTGALHRQASQRRSCFWLKQASNAERIDQRLWPYQNRRVACITDSCFSLQRIAIDANMMRSQINRHCSRWKMRCQSVAHRALTVAACHIFDVKFIGLRHCEKLFVCIKAPSHFSQGKLKGQSRDWPDPCHNFKNCQLLQEQQ